LNFQTIEIVTVMGKYFNRFYSESVNSYLSKTVNYSLSVTTSFKIRSMEAKRSFISDNSAINFSC